MTDRWDDNLPVGGRGWVKRALEAEAVIQRVRELIEQKAREDAEWENTTPFGGPSAILPGDILAALDGER